MTSGPGTGAPEAPREIGSQALAVEVGGAEFAFPIDAVVEVSHVPPITRLPFPPPAVPGVVSVRGSVLPLFDLGDRLFHRPCRRDGRIVVIEDPVEGGQLALLVDRVIDILPASESLITPPEEVLASLPAGWITGALSPGGTDRLVAMLNLPSLLERTDRTPVEDR